MNTPTPSHEPQRAVAVICLNATTAPLVERIAQALRDADQIVDTQQEAPSESLGVHDFAGLCGHVEVHGFRSTLLSPDVSFEDVSNHFQSLVRAGVGIVAVCAVPVVVRVLAPLLADNEGHQGAVVAVSADGRFAVPVLGSHRASPSANELARVVARGLGGEAAVTTASDNLLGLALDAPPVGWRLGNPGDYKAFAARLLVERRLRLEPAGSAVPQWLSDANVALVDDADALALHLSEKDISGSADALVLHPARLALGVGCERGAEVREIETLVRETLQAAGLSAASVAAVFSADLKSDETAVHQLAHGLGVPARFFSIATLLEQTDRLATPSERVFREVGCYGVAEGAALAAAGPDGELLISKRKSQRATCALALAPQPIDPATVGAPRGVLTVLGTGPGGAATFTPEARAAAMSATHLVGYGLYLDLLDTLLGGFAPSQQRHDYGLGEERERVRAALALAADGQSVALVCSGDPGIYALATLAVEQMLASQQPAEQRVDLRILPGISAAQLAAARAGAPLGHDFCFISLSDLLTPIEAIETRVQAAARGDFVIAFYNPVSKRRREPFERAVRILRAAREASTPVILARSLGRPEEALHYITLGELAYEAVDMLTTVIVGSSQSLAQRLPGGRELVFTPRGYDVAG